MPRLTDIDDIRNSLNDGLVRVAFGDLNKPNRSVVTTAFVSGRKNSEIYESVREKMKSGMFTVFNFVNRTYAPNNPQYVYFLIQEVERTCNSIKFVLKADSSDFHYEEFFESVNTSRWNILMRGTLGYVGFEEISGYDKDY